MEKKSWDGKAFQERIICLWYKKEESKPEKEQIKYGVEELEKYTNIDKRYFNRWFNTTTPELGSVIKIAEVFHCTTDYLLGIGSITEESTIMEALKDILLYNALHQETTTNSPYFIDIIVNKKNIKIDIDVISKNNPVLSLIKEYTDIEGSFKYKSTEEIKKDVNRIFNKYI